MTIAQAIVATISYHDIFDYPLTSGEIYNYLIGKKARLTTIEKELDRLKSGPINYAPSHFKLEAKEVSLSPGQLASGITSNNSKTTLYCLNGRNVIFKSRLKRQKISEAKLKLANFYSTLLMLIPTVQMVALSGALAMKNSHLNDDIDLVIVTSKGWLWTTRLLASVILFPFKRKPQPKSSPYNPHDSSFNNKACLNLFIDESDLIIRDQNIYTAHEICQMRMLWDRNKTYSRFINSNHWISQFLPNWQIDNRKIKNKNKSKSYPKIVLIWRYILHLLEENLKCIQIKYMKDRITIEKIGKTQIFFHPRDTQKLILNQYQAKLRDASLSKFLKEKQDKTLLDNAATALRR